MAIAPTLQKYLDQHVIYDVLPHEPTMSSMRTAEACHISGDCLIKGVVLRRDGGYMLAALPASHHVRLPDLSDWLGEKGQGEPAVFPDGLGEVEIRVVRKADLDLVADRG